MSGEKDNTSGSRLILAEDHSILDADAMILDLLGYDLEGLRGCQLESILTRSSSMFLHIHFQTMMNLDGKMEKLQLSLRSNGGKRIPVLMNVRRAIHDGRAVFECELHL